MFEPPILNQLMGVGGLLIGFLGAGILVHQREQQELEERRLQEEQDTKNVRDFNKILEMGRDIERQKIRENIRRPFPGFTYDNEKPEGLEPERLALPEPRSVRYANRMG